MNILCAHNWVTTNPNHDLCDSVLPAENNASRHVGKATTILWIKANHINNAEPLTERNSCVYVCICVEHMFVCVDRVHLFLRVSPVLAYNEVA